MKKTILLGLALFVIAPLSAQASSFETEVEMGVNFRTSPSTDGAKIRMLSRGEDIHVLDQVNNYWLKVQDRNGTVGYISANSKYTDYQPGSSSNAASGTITSGVNFRSSPKVASNQIGFVPRGSKVQVLDVPNQWWVKILYNGKVGYVSANYISLSSSGSTPAPAPAPSQGSSTAIADRIISHSKSLMGKVTYDFGTRNPSKFIFDCSSFTEYVFEKEGIEMKWGTKYQQYMGTSVSKSNLRKGDLVFFGTSNKQVVDHVGIYIGGGQFIHNTPSVDGLSINSLNSGYWEDHYIKARRVL